MAFTRFNYEKCRVQKSLQQATGPGRYMLNVPGNAGDKPEVFNDPQLRMQKWGGNLMGVYNGHPIDIDSDLKNVGRKLTLSNTTSQNDPVINLDSPMNNPLEYPFT